MKFEVNENEMCGCVRCQFCDGTGFLCVDWVTGDISAHPVDDLYDLETCEECGGLGHFPCADCREKMEEMEDDDE